MSKPTFEEEDLFALVTDRVGVCVKCGSMTHPVDHPEPCTACCGYVVGILGAIELGAVTINKGERQA
jgi:hypothetical protein